MADNEIIVDGLTDVEAFNTSVDAIDSENINLIFVGIDTSGSMDPYTDDMKHSLKEFKDALSNSKEKDEILVARADFSNSVNINGYKKIDEFDTSFTSNDMTAMYDAITTGTEKLKEYRKFLKDSGMRVKAVFAIFSDGLENFSKSSFNEAKTAVKWLNEEEITTAFIAFGGESTDTAKELGFKNIMNTSASASELRKAFNCLSKSVIASSKSVLSDEDDFFKV